MQFIFIILNCPIQLEAFSRAPTIVNNDEILLPYSLHYENFITYIVFQISGSFQND